ncbi:MULTISPECIES: cytochrome b/b6 domain-containing protein [Ramlibacter]|uniref:Cytochrome B n=1 Tax=Ramlibacter pinisoli TaxID=2682844 RepID=A0A6N8IX55_9BURK|nr:MULTISPECIES: cytochrome b/b6 domain-containing protein [Ramlibacter]MBA2965607.1 cytochrome b/b6 domain-containing protein [Ramlibacter sp. CGMCC 1.13660]MVQ30573.1 cytochrome B [Ramlibacter pinisoli]
MPTTVRVWDLPTRCFHWALAACVLGSLATAWAPGSWVEWHARLGYVALTLLVFRLLWGLFGGRWSRFTSFLYSPRSVLAYLRGTPHPDHLVGHNPLGAGSVLAMLVVLLVQVGTGLVSDDEIAFQGPLNRFVSSSKGLAATAYHKDIGQWLVLALVLLHVGAIAFYRLKKGENLVRPMLVGDKVVPGAVASSRDDAAMRLLALVVFAACAGGVAWLVTR